MSVSIKMSLNLNKYGLEMQAAWKEVMNDDTDINWVQTYKQYTNF